MSSEKLIDNIKSIYSDVLKNEIKKHKHLSITTGYWDLKGTLLLIDGLENYEEIRLIIGKEPNSNSDIKNISELKEYSDFPDKDIKKDLESIKNYDNQLRECARKIFKLIDSKKLKVKVFRKPFLHAKTFIFGNFNSENPIAFVGSSNWTYAGLSNIEEGGNIELNYSETEKHIIQYPVDAKERYGHLSWFEYMWNHKEAVDWTGDFKEIIGESSVGGETFGPYDVYIKTLMEIFPDELIPPINLGKDTKDVLFAFQNRNAGLLISKLQKKGVAMLSDSVGLGKTITAGAVIKHYLDDTENGGFGKTNIKVIVPAALQTQWEDDLSRLLELEKSSDYELISQQDIAKIEKTIENYNKYWRRNKEVDLFVIDEAHNLRNKGKRSEVILELLQQHPDADVLLLTATPINNSLLDISKQIQLASKGKLFSVSVPYLNPPSSQSSKRILETIDFFDAIERIQSRVKRAENKGEKFDFDDVKETIHAGLDHYLVRSTRQGVEKEGSLKTNNNKKVKFPKSNVSQIKYEFSNNSIKQVQKEFEKDKEEVFENIETNKLNLEFLNEITQQSSHPLDFLKKDQEQLNEHFDIEGNLFENENVNSVIPNILQAVYTLGFSAYRPEIYKHKFYGKSLTEIQSLNLEDKDIKKIRTNMAIHNILHITWLKRLESSGYALFKSAENYEKRIEMFEKYLNKGFIVSLKDAWKLENDYADGDDMERAFDEYDNYLKMVQNAEENGEDTSEIKLEGVERIEADRKIYNIDQLRTDLERDKKILSSIKGSLKVILNEENNAKLASFKEFLKDSQSETIQKKYGKKVLVFSFFADTIDYLKNSLKTNDLPQDFQSRTEFLTGKDRRDEIEKATNRFSPESKQYFNENGELLNGDTEIDFLFSTDVLSEGQNLQDSAVLVNYDLHWNPVRMIQRNGRINRIGSSFQEVQISNMYPEKELDLYLKLVNRLENKIRTIKNTVGLDQGVLDNQDINPIEFVERLYTKNEMPPDEKDDILVNSDKHMLHLRDFIGVKRAENKEVEIERIKNIPKGKWNYLPKESNSKNTLALTRAKGKYSVSDENFEDMFFFEIDKNNQDSDWGDFGGYSAKFIERAIALDLIATSPNDNKKSKDNIKIDRQRIRDNVITASKREFENPKFTFKIEPRHNKAIEKLIPYFPKGTDILTVIENNVKDIKVKNQLEKNLRQVNNDVRESGSLKLTTIQSFKSIYDKISKNESEKKKFESTDTVLFYEPKNKEN